MNILIAEPIASSGIEILREAGWNVDVRSALTPAEIERIIGDYDAVIVRSQTRLTARAIRAAKRLKVIGRAVSRVWLRTITAS